MERLLPNSWTRNWKPAGNPRTSGTYTYAEVVQARKIITFALQIKP